jgi:hypothetical protein
MTDPEPVVPMEPGRCCPAVIVPVDMPLDGVVEAVAPDPEEPNPQPVHGLLFSHPDKVTPAKTRLARRSPVFFPMCFPLPRRKNDFTAPPPCPRLACRCQDRLKRAARSGGI